MMRRGYCTCVRMHSLTHKNTSPFRSSFCLNINCNQPLFHPYPAILIRISYSLPLLLSCTFHTLILYSVACSISGLPPLIAAGSLRANLCNDLLAHRQEGVIGLIVSCACVHRPEKHSVLLLVICVYILVCRFEKAFGSPLLRSILPLGSTEGSLKFIWGYTNTMCSFENRFDLTVHYTLNIVRYILCYQSSTCCSAISKIPTKVD